MFEPFAIPRDIQTPCLVVDVDRVRSNIARTAKGLAERGVSWRPHAKTHKSFVVAQMQIDAGAKGIALATIDDVETFANAGFEDIFLAYTTWPAGANGDRLRAAASKTHLTVGVDSERGAKRLGEVMQGHPLDVMVEVNCGGNRCGVPSKYAGVIADAAKRAGLNVVGVFTHPGHAYHGRDAVGPAADAEQRELERAANALRAHGHEPTVVSAGSSPTAFLSARAPITEERPGSDVYYDLDQLALGTCSPGEIALVVATTVISTAAKTDQFVVDAGGNVMQRLSALPPFQGYGTIVEHPDAVFGEVWEEHGVVTSIKGSDVRVGDLLTVVPNHVCPVVNGASEILVVENGKPVDVWKVDASERRVVL